MKLKREPAIPYSFPCLLSPPIKVDELLFISKNIFSHLFNVNEVLYHSTSIGFIRHAVSYCNSGIIQYLDSEQHPEKKMIKPTKIIMEHSGSSGRGLLGLYWGIEGLLVQDSSPAESMCRCVL